MAANLVRSELDEDGFELVSDVVFSAITAPVRACFIKSSISLDKNIQDSEPVLAR